MPSHPDRVRSAYIGYAPPMNTFERWRDRTWPKWAKAIWPIRRGAIMPITYDCYATSHSIYFLSAHGPMVVRDVIETVGDSRKPKTDAEPS